MEDGKLEVLKELMIRIKEKDEETRGVLNSLREEGDDEVAIDYHMGRSSAYLKVGVEINKMVEEIGEKEDGQ